MTGKETEKVTGKETGKVTLVMTFPTKGWTHRHNKMRDTM